MTRTEAIKMLNRLLLYCDECPHGDCEKCVEAINMAEDALEQEPKRGKWIEIDEYSECSCCGAESCGETPFCPYCGARMEVEK